MTGPARPRGPEERSSGRRRALATALALVALFALLIFLLRPSSKTPEPPPGDAPASKATGAKPGARASRPGAADAVAAGPAPAPSSSSDDWDPSSPPGTDISDPKTAAKAFPYPPGSQPLTELVDPMSQAKEEDTVDAAQDIHCIFGPRVAVVHPPDALVIDLEVHGKLGVRMPITGGVARFRPDGTTVEKGPWFSTPITDDGRGKDLLPQDRAYTATYVPTSAEQATLLKGGTHVFVEVSFEAPNGLGKRTYSTVMQYARKPSAALSGQYSDQKEQGSLVVRAGVTVEKPGAYRVIGSLFGPGGDEAIAFASKSVTLPAGDGTVPLLFFGKILHDKHLDGPYELRAVMLFEETNPADVIPGEAVDHAYTTKAYRADEFSPDDYAQPKGDFEVVDMNHPSQKDKPPPLHDDRDRERIAGKDAPIKPDPPGKTPTHTFTPGTPGYGK